MGDTKSAFADDCFGRKEFADNLLKLIKNQKGYESRVIAIKADFGLGKTFFAEELKKLMKEHLSNSQDLPEIYPHYINIWKEDYTNEPLLALLYALEKIANEYQDLWDKKIIQEVIKHGIATGQVLCESFYPFGNIISRMIDKFDEIEKGNIFINETKMENFIKSISKVFNDMENKKVVIIIDEIDRCMPEYAIRFLETLKHFFDENRGLYFILMFNENHLKKSIKKQFCYIDFALWKDKFIDLEFDLSVFCNQENFIKYLVEQKYKFDGKIDNKMENIRHIIMYNKTKHEISSSIYYNDMPSVWSNGWISYINSFLNSLDIKNLNYRQLNTLCLRLSLALEILGNEVIMPDCLICIILKDILGNKKIKQDCDNKRDFIYIEYMDKEKDSVNRERKHIMRLFYGADIQKIIDKDKYFPANKKAAEFAILADKTKE